MYSMTNASSLENLVDKIAQFAVAAGWTQHKNTIAGSLRTIALRKGGDYIHIWNSSTTVLNISGSVGFTSGNAPRSQPNQSIRYNFATTGAGPFANVFMFADNSPAEHVHVAIEIAGGFFRHFSFGLLDKTCAGTYAGGTYFGCINWDTSTSRRGQLTSTYHNWMFGGGSQAGANGGGVRVDHGALTNYFAPFIAAIYTTQGTEPVASGLVLAESTADSGNYGDAYRQMSGYYDRSVNSWMGITPMKPIQVRLERPGNYFSMLGEVPNIRFIRMDRFTPGEETTLGTSEVWKIFPMIRQMASWSSGEPEGSVQGGFAYKKVV
ncbi:MAG: hypothetical protein ACREO4_09425 [Lysobacter sp.]